MTDYELLEKQVRALLEGEKNFLANAANFASFVYHELPEVNWAGFYFPNEGDLVLGPFGGKPACTRLAAGRGVCGRSFAMRSSVVVDDVDAFPDHIVCDTASRSELVVPLMNDEEIYGVFDIDSPVRARFSGADRAGVERLVRAFLDLTAIPRGGGAFDELRKTR